MDGWDSQRSQDLIKAPGIKIVSSNFNFKSPAFGLIFNLFIVLGFPKSLYKGS
jgi:hypothetical protein